MGDLNSNLIDLYTWCFESAPDEVNATSAFSSDQTRIVTIQQSQMPDNSMVWCVGGQFEGFNITSFELDLSSGIDSFKQAWSNKDNPI